MPADPPDLFLVDALKKLIETKERARVFLHGGRDVSGTVILVEDGFAVLRDRSTTAVARIRDITCISVLSFDTKPTAPRVTRFGIHDV